MKPMLLIVTAIVAFGSIASPRATIDPKATMAVTISNIGFIISVLGDFTVDRQTAGCRSDRV